LRARCEGYRLGIAETLPRKAAKAVRPLRRGAAFVASDETCAVYLVRRPENGLLGAMLQPPLGIWSAGFPSEADALAEAPFAGRWTRLPGVVRHVFTHFALELQVYAAHYARRPNGEGLWLAPAERVGAALPTVMRKVIAHALAEDAPLFSHTSSARTR
jgi:A/G-specific adenine glycosylase